MPAPSTQRGRPSPLLDDLLNNTLDPGYRAAAARARRRRWWDGPMVWLGCLAVGLLLVVAYQQQHRSAPARDAANHELIGRIKAAQAAGNRMADQTKQLAAAVAALRDAQLSGSSNQLQQLGIAAGAVPVSGPGMQIELNEAPAPTSSANGRPGTTPQSQVAVLHDRDIRAVVNQLWSAGAEAISVNGLRLTPISVIRVAGESILIDLQPINPPYTISAIGDRDGLAAGLRPVGDRAPAQDDGRRRWDHVPVRWQVQPEIAVGYRGPVALRGPRAGPGNAVEGGGGHRGRPPIRRPARPRPVRSPR